MENQQGRITEVINYRQLYENEKTLRISLQKELEIQRIRVKKLVQTKSNAKICPNCISNSPNHKINDLFVDPQGFSNKIETILSKPLLSPRRNSPSVVELRQCFDLVHNFAVFGIPQNSFQLGTVSDKSLDEVTGDVLYSKGGITQIESQAAKLIFPSGMTIRKLTGQKAKDKALQMMSFCYTNLKSFVLNFQHPEKNFNQEQYDKNQLLTHLNPKRKLFCTCIGINDYTWLKDNPNLSTSLSLKEEVQIFQPQHKKISSMNFTQLSQQPKITSEIGIAITQRVFCILSYYPFFSFFQDIIRNLINIVKMERLTIYKHKDEDLKLIDSQFQLNRIKQLFEQCLKDMSIKLQLNKNLQVRLFNGQKITLNTQQKVAKNYFIEDWIFPILSMFSSQTFLDLFTLLMLQDRLVFLCDNSHILTYTIYLFAQILTKPFNYAFPVVNIIPNQDLFLDAPFPIVYGMLKKRKYIEQNKIIEKYKNTYIFLSPDKVDIVYTESKKSFLKIRSQKLKNIISPIFKDLKRLRTHQKSTKYGIQTNQYCSLSTFQERQLSVKIIQQINKFVYEQLAKPLPSRHEIQIIKQNLSHQTIPKQKDQHSYLMDQFLSQLKKKNIDPFLQKFLDTQMINDYLLQ